MRFKESGYENEMKSMKRSRSDSEKAKRASETAEQRA